MKKKLSAKGFWKVLKDSFKGFSEDKITKLSASLAYYTVFSLGPLLIVIIFIASIFLGREAIEGTINEQIQGFVGADAAKQVQDIIKNASIGGKGKVAAVIGVITLLVGATTVFAEIQDSINTIWGLKAKPKLGVWKLVKDRLFSFGIIGSLGFLLLVSLGATAVVEALGNRLKDAFPDVTVVVFYIINLVLTLVVVSALFAVIFKVLPDAKIKWKDVLAGAIATAILFMLGKFAISFYISKSDIGSTYGTAGSLVVLLVWIYYSSIILYFGAEFTKSFAMEYATAITPSKFAVVVKKVEVEDEAGTVQEGEQQKDAIANKEQPAGKKEDRKEKQHTHHTEEKKEEKKKEPETHYRIDKQHWSPMPFPKVSDKRPDPEPIPFSEIKKEKKKEEVGILTVLGGLLLYVVNTTAKEVKDTSRGT